MTADWLPGVVAGAVTGITGSGLAAWLQRPAAHAAAEIAKAETEAVRTENEARQDRRRELIDQAYKLVADANAGSWSSEQVGNDERFLRIRTHLPESAQKRYARRPFGAIAIPLIGDQGHDDLARWLDALTVEWHLD